MGFLIKKRNFLPSKKSCYPITIYTFTFLQLKINLISIKGTVKQKTIKIFIKNRLSKFLSSHTIKNYTLAKMNK